MYKKTEGAQWFLRLCNPACSFTLENKDSLDPPSHSGVPELAREGTTSNRDS